MIDQINKAVSEICHDLNEHKHLTAIVKSLNDGVLLHELTEEEQTLLVRVKSALGEDQFEEWAQSYPSEKTKTDELARDLKPAYQPDIFMTDLMSINDAKPHEALFKLGENLFMPKGEVCVLASEGGIGKSMLALHLGVALAMPESERYLHLKDKSGTPLAACPSHTPKVVLLFAEESKNTISYRLKTLLPKGPSGTVERGLLRSLNGRLIPAPLRANDINRESDISLSESPRFGELGEAERRFHELYAALKSLGCIDLIVVDPLAQFGGGDFEKDNGEASKLMRQFQRLTGLEGNPTVLLIHHSPKTTKGGKLAHTIRGASALRANSRWAGLLRKIDEDETGMEFLRDEDGRTVLELIVTKSNYGPNGLSVRYLVDGCKIEPIVKGSHLLSTTNRSDEGLSAPRSSQTKSAWSDVLGS